jgi:coenzyme F420-reducing hydrogenase beta subunit
MIQLPDQKLCCACGACLQACPVKCITFIHDAEGFEYPSVNQAICTKCGRCEQVCPVLKPYESQETLSAYGVINTDKKVRLESSSGGVFHVLANEVLRDGGIVVGAMFNENFTLRHQCITDSSMLQHLCGSKYIQSSNTQAFCQVRDYLKQNKKVLFTGTPCQVAGLRRFLGQDYPTLLTADFFCHGVPSPKVWQRFLDEVLAQKNLSYEDVASISFRNKDKGWREYQFVMKLKSGQQVAISHRRNAYQRAFDENLTLRPSCYNCPARAGRSHSDLTLADFWDVARVRPDIDDNKGVSLVLFNTQRGKEALNHDGLICFNTDVEEALRHNSAFRAEHSIPHPQRTHFFEQLSSAASVAALIEQSLYLPLRQRLTKELSLRIYLFKQHLMRLLK